MVSGAVLQCISAATFAQDDPNPSLPKAEVLANPVDSMPYVNLVSNADNKRELSILFDKDGVLKKYLLMDQ